MPVSVIVKNDKTGETATLTYDVGQAVPILDQWLVSPFTPNTLAVVLGSNNSTPGVLTLIVDERVP